MANASCSFLGCSNSGAYICTCMMPRVIICPEHIRLHCQEGKEHNIKLVESPKPLKLDENSKKIIANHFASINTEISIKIKGLIAETTEKINVMKLKLKNLINENRISTEKYREIINFIYRDSHFPEPYSQLNKELASNQRDCKNLMQNTKFEFYDSIYQEIKKYENFISSIGQSKPSCIWYNSEILKINSQERNLIENSPDTSINTPDSMITELWKENLVQENKKLLEKINQLEEIVNIKNSDINKLRDDFAYSEKKLEQKSQEKNEIIEELENLKMKFSQKENEDKKLNMKIEDLQKANFLKDIDNQSLKEQIGKLEKELKLENRDKDVLKIKVEERLKDKSEQENRENNINKYKKSEQTEIWDNEDEEPSKKSGKLYETKPLDSSSEKSKNLMNSYSNEDAWKDAEVPNQRLNGKSPKNDSWDINNENSKQNAEQKIAEDPWNKAEPVQKHSNQKLNEKSHIADNSDRKSGNSKKYIDDKAAKDAWKAAEVPQNRSNSRSNKKSYTTESWDRQIEQPIIVNSEWAQNAWNEAEASQRHSHSRSNKKSYATESWDSQIEQPTIVNSEWAQNAWNEAEASQRHSHSRSREKSHTRDNRDSKMETPKKPMNSRWTRDTEVKIPRKHSKSRSSEKRDRYESPRKIPKLNTINEWKCKSIFPGTKTAYFKDKSKILRTKNLNQLNETEILTNSEDYELSELPETISTYIAMCQIPSEAIFCYGNLYDGHATGITFIIESDFSLVMREYGKPRSHSSVCYYHGSVYAFGGSNDNGKTKEASRFSFNSHIWKDIADMPEVSNFCTTLAYEDKIYIAGPSLSKIYIYNPRHDRYDIVQEYLEIEKPKLLLSLYDKIYLLQSEGDLLVYDGRWNRTRNTAEFFAKNPSSFRVIYKKNIYFTCGDAKYYKFSSRGELGHAFGWI